jgi:hypothetical protein
MHFFTDDWAAKQSFDAFLDLFVGQWLVGFGA